MSLQIKLYNLQVLYIKYRLTNSIFCNELKTLL